MKIGYARVSTSGQGLEVQLEALAKAGCDTENIFQEKQSGKATDSRKQLQSCLKFIRKGDTLVVTKLDRLARSVYDLHTIAQTLKEKGADLVALDQPEIDTASKYGKLVFSILGAVAELERDLILERTNEGRLRARAQGVKFGRKEKLSKAEVKKIKQEFSTWEGSKADLAAKYGISRSSIYRLCSQAK